MLLYALIKSLNCNISQENATRSCGYFPKFLGPLRSFMIPKIPKDL